MGDCKAYNGRLQSLQWTIAKLAMDHRKNFYGRWQGLFYSREKSAVSGGIVAIVAGVSDGRL
ncbi:MAG: hypothetical protein PUI38_05645 [Candidatus Treponema excrementipullorum]|nr:hypothetical protein [Spirochaetia bacterium]MDD7012322.1 hypothetical protein [Candidatus Treponema excrementipullorum]MDY4707381.1 hypothetical protein [Candidatus Treponema excrementipullorum]